MVVIGNSIALAALHYIVPAFNLSKIRHIKLLAAPGCLPIYYTETVYPKCQHFVDETIKIIRNFRPDVVFLNFK